MFVSRTAGRPGIDEKVCTASFKKRLVGVTADDYIDRWINGADILWFVHYPESFASYHRSGDCANGRSIEGMIAISENGVDRCNGFEFPEY